MLFRSHGHNKKPLAFVIDSREAEHLGQFIDDFRLLPNARLWFLEASDQTLLRRFQETRRSHPLANNGLGLLQGIQEERLVLEPLRSLATRIVSTDLLTPHDLRAQISALARDSQKSFLKIRLESFGFKYGLPQTLDLCFDVRFIQNPYFIEQLKPLTGLDTEVSQFVLSRSEAQLFLEKALDLMQFLIPCYEKENKTYLTVAIGCTGGRHRSVAITCEIARRLKQLGHEIDKIGRAHV